MNAIYKQNYTLERFITLKMAYSWCFSLGGNLDFPDFLKKSFVTSTTETEKLYKRKLLMSDFRFLRKPSGFWTKFPAKSGYGEWVPAPGSGLAIDKGQRR